MTRAQKIAAGVATALSVGLLTSIALQQDAAPPQGKSYPTIRSVDFDGDFDPGCNTSQWPQRYNEGTTSVVQTSGAGEGQCWVKITDTGSGSGTRGEFGAPTQGVGADFRYEALFYVPAGGNATQGYIAQHKQDETDGSCANGGWALPSDEGGRLLLRVRADCDEDHRDLDFGLPPTERWFAVKTRLKSANSDGVAWGRLDPDGPGPAVYGPKLKVRGDTSSGGNVKPRLGRYGTGSRNAWLGVDGYRLATP